MNTPNKTKVNSNKIARPNLYYRDWTKLKE
jgi:hypothetical protein